MKRVFVVVALYDTEESNCQNEGVYTTYKLAQERIKYLKTKDYPYVDYDIEEWEIDQPTDAY